MKRRSFLSRVGAVFALVPAFATQAKAKWTGKWAGKEWMDAVTSDNVDMDSVDDINEKLNAALQKIPDCIHIKVELRTVRAAGKPEFKQSFFRIYTSGVASIPVRDPNIARVTFPEWTGKWDEQDRSVCEWRNVKTDF